MSINKYTPREIINLAKNKIYKYLKIHTLSTEQQAPIEITELANNETDNYLKNHTMSKKKYTPRKITELANNEIFVFGSNLDGLHYGGAARVAMQWGAIMGQGVGLQGQTYAIPTMEGSIDKIKFYVDEFIDFARINTQYTFLVTRIGCGIAGYKSEEIAQLFEKAIGVDNIILPEDFVECINPELNIFLP